jgi:outer membrane protein assembly factor BamA
MLFGNYEARWMMTEVRIKDVLLQLMLVPFVDAGRVYDSWKNTTLAGMKYSYGGGFRTAINQAFVLCFDFGFSREQSAEFYMNFGTIF